MKLKISYLILFTLIANIFSANATIRFVSKTGTSTPPYTSWETAADSIQKCINISQFGDTIYVANGVYKEQVIMIPGLSLIGEKTDSSIIDTRDLITSISTESVVVADSCLFMRFSLLVYYNWEMGRGINAAIGTGTNKIIDNRIIGGSRGITPGLNTIVYNNSFENIRLGIRLFNSNAVIRRNTIIIDPNAQESLGAIDIEAFDFSYNPLIDSNYIVAISKGINKAFGSNPTISNNVIKLKNAQTGIFLSYSDSTKIYNNLIIGDNIVEGLYNTSVPNLILYNNYFSGSSLDRPIYQAMQIGPGNSVKNNVITNAVRGVYNAGTIDPEFKYNNIWNTQTKYANFTGDSTNFSVDPMILNDDSTQGEIDFHLQKYSPLIDAGDPSMIDKDSSRIDIGLYGGLYGEDYKYYDLAPRPPRNLSAAVDTNQILLKWNRNTEADTAFYKVYRDTVISFTIDSTKIVSSSTDTFFVQFSPYYSTKYVYKITCVDKQGKESNPSEEIVVDLTSVSIDDYPMTINDYLLYQNYPNPFNPSTKIAYKLKEAGYVKLYVYDIKGELISVLVNKEQSIGYYEVEFYSTSIQHPESGIKELASGVYIYQILVKGENNIPIFSDIKKMVYIK